MATVIGILVSYALVIGIVVALAALLLLVLLFVLLRRAASAKEGAAAKPAPGATAPAALVDGGSGPVPLQELQHSFAAALRYLRRVTPGYRWRYAIPWYLVLGEKGSGKTTVLSELEAMRPAGAMQAEPPQASRALTWHFFDGGVVLDVAGQLVLDPERQSGDDRAWRQLQRLLAENRPIRPVDGIVVTLPCGDFLGPGRLDADALLAKADHMHRHLLDLQQRLGLQLPIYVLVTKCDWVPGFQSFWREAPASRRDEIFGWSNGHDLDAEVTAAGFDQAFNGLTETLYRLHLDLAGKEADLADPEGALLFPTEFDRLREPLRLYCTSLFRQSVYHDAFFFRGLYFTGDGGPPPRRMGGLALAAPREPAPAEPLRRWPLFTRDLFAKKILRERNLAAIARSGQMPRTRPVRIAAACLAGLVVVGAVGLTVAGLRLKREAKSLMQPVTFIVQSMSREQLLATNPNAAPVSVSDATELLGMFAKLNVRRLRTAWMPTSWFSGIDDRIVDHFSLGFDTVILDAMRREFDRRTASLIDDATAGRGAPPAGKPYALAGSPSARRIAAYVDGLRQIEHNATIYNRLGTPQGSLADIEALTTYLLNAKLPHDFFVDSDLYSAALHHLAIRPFDPRVYRTPAVAGLQVLLQPFDQLMAGSGPIMDRFSEVTASVAGLDRAVATRGDAGGQLRRLGGALASVQTMLADPDFAWVLQRRVESDADFAALLNRIGSSAFFGPTIAQTLQARADLRLQQLQAGLVQVPLRGTTPLLDQSAGHLVLRLSPPAESLAAALPKMLERSFMATPEARSIAAPGRGRASGWDPDRLAQAIALYQSYELFLDAELQQTPADFRRVVDAAARQRLDANMVAAIAKAQTDQAAAGGNQSPDMTLFLEAQAFGRAARPLGDLLTVLSQLGFDHTYSQLRDVTGREAYGMLEQVDALLTREQLYAVRRDIQPWNPTVPATLAAFGLRDDVEVAQYLDTERNWVARLANDGAQPLLDFLTRSDFTFNWRPVPLVPKWQRILIELQKYQNNNPRNSVSTLENFIRFDLAAVTPDNCVGQLRGARYAGTGDYFLDRRDALRQDLLGQCSSIASKSGAAGYAQLADQFNRALAGRFPFAATAPENDADEATLGAVVDYFRLFAANAPQVRKDLADGSTADEQDELAFLDQMEKVRAFLAPFLEQGGTELPGFDVAADFRVNRGAERGADQIIEWHLAIADQVLSRGQKPEPARWHLSDPVTVTLRWAKNGPTSPVLQGVSDAQEMQTRLVTWTYDDRWALLHLMVDHRTPTEQLDRRSDLAPQVLKFTAQTVQVIGPETRAPGPVGEARAFIRVRLSTLPPGGKAPVPLVMPAFPTHAPLQVAAAPPSTAAPEPPLAPPVPLGKATQ
jgi:type VI secretion system protein ImpL